MKNYLIPAIGVIVVTIILVVINEYTETTLVRDYAYFFIIGAMLLGVALTRFSQKGDPKA